MTLADHRERAHIDARIDKEIAQFDPARRRHGIADWNEATLAAFKKARISPDTVEINLPGGITDFAYSVTQSNGDYRVVYLPWLGLFSLAVESKFGPIDINVHGSAIDCFASV